MKTDLSVELAKLKPSRKDKVFDLLQSVEFDLSDWIATATNPAKIKANPKYCYDWSFVQAGKIAVFNLWHGAMHAQGEDIVYSDNFRSNAEFHRRNGGKTQWITRGLKLDRDAAEAARENLPIRVIVVDGQRRATDDPNSDSSKVSGRQLDPEPWHIKLYDAATGEFVLARGIGKAAFVDQFDRLAVQADVHLKTTTATIYSRSIAVRRAVLERAQGKCEYCAEPGFQTLSSQIYLETHHVVPLGEQGSDSTDNVVALCPLDHRKVHYAEEALEMREKMLRFLTLVGSTSR